MKWLKRRKLIRSIAQRVYARITEQSRNPVFYRELGVADTLYGRFELVSLHTALFVRYMRQLEDIGPKVSQKLFDLMFSDIQESLRQQGVGDLGVPKKMRGLMKGFNGRLHVYKEALDRRNSNELYAALIKNVYDGDEAKHKNHANMLKAYMEKLAQALEYYALDDLEKGAISWPEIKGAQSGQ